MLCSPQERAQAPQLDAERGAADSRDCAEKGRAPQFSTPSQHGHLRQPGLPHCDSFSAVPGSLSCRDSQPTCWLPRSCPTKQSAVRMQPSHTSPQWASTLRCAGTATAPGGRSDDALTLLTGGTATLLAIKVHCQVLLYRFMLVRLSQARCAAGQSQLGHLAVAAVIQICIHRALQGLHRPADLGSLLLAR